MGELANNLQLIAQASLLWLTKYDLDQPAVASTVEVYINGYLVQNIWYYDADQQAVIFDSNPPEKGRDRDSLFRDGGV